MQEFKRAVRGSGYKERLLVEEFKRKMNKMIKRKLSSLQMVNLVFSLFYSHFHFIFDLFFYFSIFRT